MLKRSLDPAFFNGVLNHSSVRPDVADMGDGDIDVGPLVAKRDTTVLLTGEHGGVILFKYYEGCWEVHTAILPAGRGQWAKDFAAAAQHYMFTHTDCIEVITRVPQEHVAAKALTVAAGFRPHFITAPDCLFRGKKMPCHIYLLLMQEWAMRNDAIEQRGVEFHAWLNKQVDGVPHENDPAHNKVVGLAIDMMTAGQVIKGIIWYNRWSIAARHPQISLVAQDPPSVRFDAGILTLADGGIKYSHAH